VLLLHYRFIEFEIDLHASRDMKEKNGLTVIVGQVLNMNGYILSLINSCLLFFGGSLAG
jgi:hypothetical protein